MKKATLIILGLLPSVAFAQLGIGIKGGFNFANVSSASSINSSNRSGFMFGVFLAPSNKGIISSRTELIYSKQGYDFKNGANTGNVNLDYIILPQLMGINITKFVQIQLGAQMAFLINAKADSTNSGGPMGPYSSVMGYYNKFDYAFAVGAEIHPVRVCSLAPGIISALENCIRILKPAKCPLLLLLMPKIMWFRYLPVGYSETIQKRNKHEKISFPSHVNGRHFGCLCSGISGTGIQ